MLPSGMVVNTEHSVEKKETVLEGPLGPTNQSFLFFSVNEQVMSNSFLVLSIFSYVSGIGIGIL